MARKVGSNPRETEGGHRRSDQGITKIFSFLRVSLDCCHGPDHEDLSLKIQEHQRMKNQALVTSANIK